MCDKDKLHEFNENIDISELNNYLEKRSINFSLEPVDSKPIDVSLMTGQNETNKKGSEEK